MNTTKWRGLKQREARALKALGDVREEIQVEILELFMAHYGFKPSWVLLDGKPVLAILDNFNRDPTMWKRYPPWLSARWITASGGLSTQQKYLYEKWVGRIQPWPIGHPLPEVKKREEGSGT